MTPDDITKLSKLLDIQQDLLEAELGEHWWPRRGLGPMPPNDPVLYRLYEVSAPNSHVAAVPRLIIARPRVCLSMDTRSR
jgi:hypothetical protein